MRKHLVMIAAAVLLSACSSGESAAPAASEAGSPKLEVVQDQTPQFSCMSDTLFYSISVENTGDAPLDDAALATLQSAGFEVILQADDGTGSSTANTVLVEGGSIAAGSSGNLAVAHSALFTGFDGGFGALEVIQDGVTAYSTGISVDSSICS